MEGQNKEELSDAVASAAKHVQEKRAEAEADMTTVRGALFKHLAGGSAFPDAGEWGVAPPDLSTYLDGMTFAFEDTDYQFLSVPAYARSN